MRSGPDHATREIEVVPTAEHRRARLRAALVREPAALAPATHTLDELAKALHRALLPERALAHPTVERIVAAVAPRRSTPAGSYERARAITTALTALDRAAIDEVTLEGARTALPTDETGAHERLQALSDAAGRVRARLEGQGLIARSALEAALASALDALDPDDPLPPPIGPGPTSVRIEVFGPTLDRARALWFAALARALRARGGALSVRLLVEPARERWSPALDRALQLLEDEERAPLELEFGLRGPNTVEPDPRLQAFVHDLAVGGRRPDAPVWIAEGHGPDERARAAVDRVARWLAGGFAHEDVAVVVRSGEAALLEPLVRALEEGEIPARFERECARGLERPGAVHAATALARALAEGGEIERVTFALAALAGSRVILGQPATTLAHAARIVRAKTVFDGKLEQQSKYLAAGTDVAARALKALLAPLGEPGTVEQHCARWLAFLSHIHAGSARRAAGLGAEPRGAGRAMALAAAREERAIAAIERTIAHLPRRAAQGGVRGALDPRAFAALLEDAIDGARDALDGHEASGASGVLVTTVDAAAGLSFRAVVVVGVEDGVFPAHGEDDAMLGAAERRALRSSAGIVLAQRGAGEDETQRFLAACALATERLALVGARHDAGGRARPPSPFMVDARRALDRAPLWIPHDPLARGTHLPPRGTERLTRALAARGDAPARETVSPALAGRVRSARERAEIERERAEFFSGVRAEPGRFSGRIDHDPRAIAAVALAAYATTDAPLDVTSLERAARCGFKAFAQQVLRLHPEDVPSLALDPKERGHLLHALLEAGQLALRAASDRPRAARWELAARAIDEAAERFAHALPHADPDLLRADTVAIRRKIDAFFDARLDADARWNVVATEVAFGPAHPWPALEVSVEGQRPIVLRGRIDGIERLDGSVRAVEFKSGRGDGFRKRLREGILDTQFQLVVYAAALYRAVREGRVEAVGVDVDGVYVGFRDQSEHGLREVLAAAGKKSGAAIDVEQLVREGSQGDGMLGDAIRRAVLPVRQGVFGPRPRDCDFCNAHSLCRVERTREDASP